MSSHRFGLLMTTGTGRASASRATYQRTGARKAGSDHDGKLSLFTREHNTSNVEATTFTCGSKIESG